MTRVAKGMTLEQVREIWQVRSAAKTKAIIDSYYAQRRGSGGREGLGIYGIHQERAAREKVRLAVRLLTSAGLDVSYSIIRKVTGQSQDTISKHWWPPKPTGLSAQVSKPVFDDPPPIPFPGLNRS